MPIRLLIADDDPLIREGLAVVLSRVEDFKLVAAVSNGQEAVETCVSRKIDIALIDLRMPVMDGIEAIGKIRSGSETLPIVLTTFDDDELISRALENGARGYLLKGHPPEQIINAIRTVAHGASVFQPDLVVRIQSGSSKAVPAFFNSCSSRELDVVRLIARGLSNKEIGSELCLSEGTVKNHVSMILSKLDLKHRTQIAVKFLDS